MSCPAPSFTWFRSAVPALALVLLLITLPAAPVGAQSPTSLHQLLPGAQEDAAGSSVDIDGDFLVAGVPGDDTDGTDAGAARIYTRLGGNWIHEQRLTPDEPAAADGFGTAVAIRGDVVIVGAPGDDTRGSDAGAVYVFRRVDGVWTQEQKLTAEDGTDGAGLGAAVATGQDRILVGATGEDSAATDAGAAYFFQRVEGVWLQEQKLVAAAPDAGAEFGAALALAGNHALVGAPGTGSGDAYAFQRVNGSWFQEQRLAPDNLADGDAYGTAVALTEAGRALIGAPGAERLDAPGSGTVYAFERVAGVWLQRQDIFPLEPRAGDAIGQAVAVDQGILAIGAPGDDEWGDDAGAAYVLTLQDGVWLQQTRVAGTDATDGDRLGSVAAVSAPAVVTGAPTDDVDELVDAGTVWIFVFTGPDAPRRLRARRTSGATTLSLEWRNRSPEAEQFRISRALGRTGTPEEIATVAADVTSFTDENLEPRTRYCYQVAAVNAFGATSSKLNCARTRKARPRPPRRLTAEASGGRVDLSWRDRSDNEDGFVILRKVPGNGPFSDLATVGAGVTSFTDEDVAAGTRYCYRVKAQNELGGRSASSNRDCATI